jgi:hypothetical protein
MGPNITVARTSNSKQLQDRLKTIGKRAAYVGIPSGSSSDRSASLLAMARNAATNKKKNPAKISKLLNSAVEDVTNAELLYIFSKGSPMRNQPARPVIEPAIEADGNKQIIAREIAESVKASLDGSQAGVTKGLKRAGMAGQNAARGWFTDSRNGWAQNAPSTIRQKLGTLKGKQKKNALNILDANSGPTPLVGMSASLDSINTPGIDTGAMRQALTYVVKDDE